MKKIAIIGAGLSGLTVAHYLKDLADIKIFEKSRGVSGRLSTRYADPYQFDHGAQYFTAQSKTFLAFLELYINSGLVKIWDASIVTLKKGDNTEPAKEADSPPRYISTPKMNDLGKKLAEFCQVHTLTEIAAIERQNSHWYLKPAGDEIIGPFDWVISTAPAPQTARILPTCFSSYTILEKVRMTGCFSLMLGYDKPLAIPWDAARIAGSTLAWIAVNSSKPGRNTDFSLLAQSSNDWAEAHIDATLPQVQSALVNELQALLAVDLCHYSHSSTHRWRYANTAVPAGYPYLLDKTNRLAACGDWCIKGRVEAAFTSGYELSQKLRTVL